MHTNGMNTFVLQSTRSLKAGFPYDCIKKGGDGTGLGLLGELVNDSGTDSLTPIQMAGLSEGVSVAGGQFHRIASRSGRRVDGSSRNRLLEHWYLAADSITDYPVVNDSVVLPSVSK